jgi:peptide/nickel transport system substrate-binding protein
VKWTLESMRNGSIITPKAASYASVATVERPMRRRWFCTLNRPDNFLLTNLSSGAMGIVP